MIIFFKKMISARSEAASYYVTEWSIKDSSLVMQYTGSEEPMIFSLIKNENGDTYYQVTGFKVGTQFEIPSDEWEMDTDISYADIEDMSNTQTSKDVPELAPYGIKVLYPNKVLTLRNNSLATVRYFGKGTTPTTDDTSSSNGGNGGNGGGGGEGGGGGNSTSSSTGGNGTGSTGDTYNTSGSCNFGFGTIGIALVLVALRKR